MLKGTLDDFTLPEIFRLMSLAKKTGVLEVNRKAGQGKVFFREGEVYYAESSLSKEPLGQKLVRNKALSEGQLRKALDTHAESGDRLGTVLLTQGFVTEDQLTNAVRQQIEDAAFDLLRWELGEFSWEPGVSIDPEVFTSATVENLIMEASRRLDELDVIRRKIPSEESVLAMAETPPEGAVEINITPDEWRILVLVNGNRTVHDIAESVGLDDFQAMRVLYGLVSAGLIEVPGHVADEEAAPAFEAEPEPEPVAIEAEGPVEEVEEEVAEEPFGVEPEAEEALAEEPEAITLEPEPIALEPEPELEPESAPVAEGPVGESAEEGQHPAFVAAEPEPEAEQPPTEEWFQDPEIPVESFDAPGPGELVAEAPTDPFADEILQPSEAAPEPEPEPSAEELPVPPEPEPEAEPMSEAPLPPAIPVSSEPAGEHPQVDRIAAVRELAGLFKESSEDDVPYRPPAAMEPMPTSTPVKVPEASTPEPEPEPEPEAEAPAEAQPEAAEEPVVAEQVPEPVTVPDAQEGDNRKRVEDDDQVTRSLISRLIDGVKGL